MDGILLINKPQDFTSFDVVAKLRGILKERRIGHSGTLDPMATGLLVCLLGKCTPLCDIFPEDRKEYKAGLKLGLTTDTQDIWGKTLEEKESHVKKEEFLNVLPKFTGDIVQVPPMYSALKVNGQKLCDIARKGGNVEREGRTIKIDWIKLLSFDEEKQEAEILVSCHKGTYIRTLIDDIGNALNAGASMTSLERTSSNGFDLENAYTFSEVEEMMKNGTIENVLIPNYEVFKDFKDIKVGAWQKKMITNGVKLNRDKVGNPPDGFYRLWYEDEFLGAVEYGPDSPNLKMIFRG